jgi:hypothetical protein
MSPAIIVIELVVTDHRGARSAPRRLLIQAGSPTALKPTLTRLVPDRAVAGCRSAGAFSLEGLRFDPAARVVFGATLLTTRFVNATRLSADVPATLLATPGLLPGAGPQPGGCRRRFQQSPVCRRRGDADPERR